METAEDYSSVFQTIGCTNKGGNFISSVVRRHGSVIREKTGPGTQLVAVCLVFEGSILVKDQVIIGECLLVVVQIRRPGRTPGRRMLPRRYMRCGHKLHRACNLLLARIRDWRE